MIKISLRSDFDFDSFDIENKSLLNEIYLEELTNNIFEMIVNYQEGYETVVEELEIDFHEFNNEYGAFYCSEEEIGDYTEDLDEEDKKRSLKSLISAILISGYLVSSDWQVDLRIVKR